MQKPTLRRLPLLIAAAFASEWIYAADAAQDAEQVQFEEVVVTGERANRSGFETATSNRVFTTPTSTAATTTFPRPTCSNRP